MRRFLDDGSVLSGLKAWPWGSQELGLLVCCSANRCRVSWQLKLKMEFLSLKGNPILVGNNSNSCDSCIISCVHWQNVLERYQTLKLSFFTLLYWFLIPSQFYELQVSPLEVTNRPTSGSLTHLENTCCSVLARPYSKGLNLTWTLAELLFPAVLSRWQVMYWFINLKKKKSVLKHLKTDFLLAIVQNLSLIYVQIRFMIFGHFITPHPHKGDYLQLTLLILLDLSAAFWLLFFFNTHAPMILPEWIKCNNLYLSLKPGCQWSLKSHTEWMVDDKNWRLCVFITKKYNTGCVVFGFMNM